MWMGKKPKPKHCLHHGQICLYEDIEGLEYECYKVIERAGICGMAQSPKVNNSEPDNTDKKGIYPRCED
jgi:hypothetical protein